MNQEVLLQDPALRTISPSRSEVDEPARERMIDKETLQQSHPIFHITVFVHVVRAEEDEAREPQQPPHEEEVQHWLAVPALPAPQQDLGTKLLLRRTELPLYRRPHLEPKHPSTAFVTSRQQLNDKDTQLGEREKHHFIQARANTLVILEESRRSKYNE
ncbi:hypothetical protein RvY_17766-1 [Ramazzottius varieornatus]|uniref:Uncharacterized protein n=1 Tax=Ramazzottius varieornatus TaxID=947166 RepID=A0A1D1W398_RAMVA|nr:hypothetical protein RvY_17766-1 [Ramazzottius varieornatus]